MENRFGYRRKTKSFICYIFVIFYSLSIEADPNLPCHTAQLSIDKAFEGGNFYSCSMKEVNSVEIEIRAENEGEINQSPWYAFRVQTRDDMNLEIKINFDKSYARYWPKFSLDGEQWSRLPEIEVKRSENNKSLIITREFDEGSVWISAQELLMPSFYKDWIKGVHHDTGFSTSTIGYSVENRPIRLLRMGKGKNTLVLLGRQHPPEVSGSLAMISFVKTLMSDSALAITFRDEFTILVVPLINPDGVFHGYWRHNMNGVDLNRDWGTFTQPETLAVSKLLKNISEEGLDLKLMLDFHSTKESVFYTQLPSESDGVIDFASIWLDRSKKRLPNFTFKHDARAPSGQKNTKNYFFKRYDIPAITYELADEVNRKDIEISTLIFGEEMMRLLLERTKIEGAEAP